MGKLKKGSSMFCRHGDFGDDNDDCNVFRRNVSVLQREWIHFYNMFIVSSICTNMKLLHWKLLWYVDIENDYVHLLLYTFF